MIRTLLVLSVCLALFCTVQGTTYGAFETYDGTCATEGGTIAASALPQSANFYDMSGACVTTQTPNAVNRRRRYTSASDTDRRRRDLGSSYKATATELKVWEGESATCETGQTHTTTTAAGGCVTGRRRRVSFTDAEMTKYSPNEVLGANYLFYYKSYNDANCNTAGTQPASGSQYVISAAPAACKVRKESNGDDQSGYSREYRFEEWSYGSLPDMPGPFIRVSGYNGNVTALGSAACTPTSGIPIMTKYVQASTTGTCTQVDSDSSFKVTKVGTGGVVQFFGRRRRASTDCSTVPTAIIKSGASVPVPAPVSTTGGTPTLVVDAVAAEGACTLPYWDQATDSSDGSAQKIEWDVTTPTVYSNQWIHSQGAFSVAMPSGTTHTQANNQSNWPASETHSWACAQFKARNRIVNLYDSSQCIWNKYLVTAPPQSSTIKQQFTYSHLSVAAFAGDTKVTYETGYGLALGIYAAVTGWMQGCSVSSTATASTRRSGISVEYSVVVPQTQAATVTQASAAVTPTTMATQIAAAATTLNTAVTAPTAAQTTATAPTTQTNADPTSRTVAGSASMSAAGRQFQPVTSGVVGLLLVALSMLRLQ